MEYIYAPDADEVLDAENRARFRDLKNCLLPEIEIVQMWYVTEAFNTVMNVKRELRPKLFKRLRMSLTLKMVVIYIMAGLFNHFAIITDNHQRSTVRK